MKCKRKIMVGIAFVAVVLCILFQSNTFGRKKSELIIEEVDLKNNCIYATAKNQLYDTDDNYIIYGVCSAFLFSYIGLFLLFSAAFSCPSLPAALSGLLSKSVP